MHAAANHFINHSNAILAPSNIERLLKSNSLLPTTEESIIREVLAKLITLPSSMMIKSVSRHIGFLFPVPFLDPELLNSKVTDTSLH